MTGLARAEEHRTETASIGIALDGYDYPFEVNYLPLEIEGQTVRMAYMDVAPAQSANGKTVILFHGKNFSSDYWSTTIKALTAAGYRVIAPDQIGFGKSSKPEIHYSFDLLARNTSKLLDALGVHQVFVVGNSMGGMLAVRFSRLNADRVEKLVLENPIGLEDYRLSIPPQTTEDLLKQEIAQTPESYLKFIKSYFPVWHPEFARYAETYSRVQLSGEYPRYAKASVLTYQMIYEQPVCYELPYLTMPTLLIIGQLDHTVLGRRFAPPEKIKALGNFSALGKAVAKQIPHATLSEFEGVGHVPHLESPERFDTELIKFFRGTSKD